MWKNCEQTIWNLDTLIKFFFSLLQSTIAILMIQKHSNRDHWYYIVLCCHHDYWGDFLLPDKVCTAMWTNGSCIIVPSLLLCFMFITTNFRLAGGYHLPSAVDVVFGGEKKVSNILLYILFSLGKKLGDKKYEQLKDQE